MGGRGGSSKLESNSQKISALKIFKENAAQFNKAIERAKTEKASILEYTEATGKIFTRYWNGATFTDRKSALYERERKGTLKVKFKIPKE